MTSRWSRPTRLTWIGITLSLAISAATAAFLWATYATLPYGVPVRFVQGEPLIYQVKTPMLVMLPAVVQLALLTIFGMLLLVLLWRARAPRVATTPIGEGRADSRRMTFAAEGVALLALVWIAVQGLSAIRLVLLWKRGSGGFGVVYTLILVIGVVLSIVIAARTMKLVGRERRSVAPQDPALWRWRHLYFNPDDPALFVSTRTGFGWTLNFGRPLAIALIAATLIVGVAAPYYLARLVLRLGD